MKIKCCNIFLLGTTVIAQDLAEKCQLTTKAQWNIDQTGKKWTYGPECASTLWSLSCSNTIPWNVGEDGWWNGWHSYETVPGPEYLLRQMHETNSCTNKIDNFEVTSKTIIDNGGERHSQWCTGIRPRNKVVTVYENADVSIDSSTQNFGPAVCVNNDCHVSAEACSTFCSNNKFNGYGQSSICRSWIYVEENPNGNQDSNRCNVGSFYPPIGAQVLADVSSYGTLATSGYVIQNERTVEYHEGFNQYYLQVENFNTLEDKKLQYENDIVLSNIVRNGKLQTIQKHDCNLVEYEQVSYVTTSKHIMEISNHLETCAYGK